MNKLPRRSCVYSFPLVPSRSTAAHTRSLAVADVRDDTFIVEVDVEAVLVVVLGHHGAGLDDAVLGGEVFLAEALRQGVSDVAGADGEAGGDTSALESDSCSFLPDSLFVHSSVLSPKADVIPGAMRGMAVCHWW